MKKFTFLISMVLTIFLFTGISYAQFISNSRTYNTSGEVIVLTDHYITIRDDFDEERMIFEMDEDTEIEGELSKGDEVSILYKRKEKALSGWLKLATKITVDKNIEDEK